MPATIKCNKCGCILAVVKDVDELLKKYRVLRGKNCPRCLKPLKIPPINVQILHKDKK